MFETPGWNSYDEEQEKLAEKLFADVPSKPKKRKKHKEDDVDARPKKLSKKAKKGSGGVEEKIVNSETKPDKKLKLLMEMLEGKRNDQGESKEISPNGKGKISKGNVNKQSADSKQQSVFVVGSNDSAKKRKKKKKKKLKKSLKIEDSTKESKTQDIVKGNVHEDSSLPLSSVADVKADGKKRKREKSLKVEDSKEESKTQDIVKGNVQEDNSLWLSSVADVKADGKKRKREKSLEVENTLDQSVSTDIEKSKISNNYSLSMSKTADELVAKKKRKTKKVKQAVEGEENCVNEELLVEITTSEKSFSMKQEKVQKEEEETSTCLRTEQQLERTDDSQQSHTKQTDHKMIHSKMSVCDAPAERTKSKATDFKSKLQKKLSGAQFRWINEQLYTTESQNAFDMFSKDPNLFDIYHKGFQNQVEAWPQNPVEVMIRYLNERPSDIIVADMGCGEAKISQNVKQKVHSFDLVSHNEFVTACDMSKVPIDPGVVDVAIFCLSLMGTNIVDFLKEANRILKHGGILKIAEVVSRFENITKFIENVCSLGFKFLSMDSSNKMFVLIDFEKISKAKLKTSHALHLKPCIYKRR